MIIIISKNNQKINSNIIVTICNIDKLIFMILVLLLVLFLLIKYKKHSSKCIRKNTMSLLKKL